MSRKPKLCKVYRCQNVAIEKRCCAEHLAFFATHCGAKGRQRDDPCRDISMANGRCRKHGGKSLGGIASATAKTLEHSKFLPPRLGPRYDEMRADQDLLTLKREVALVRTRLTELLGKIDEGGGSSAVKQSVRAFRELRNAMAAQDKLATEKAFGELSDGLARLEKEVAVWDDINSQIGILTRVSESERKREMDADYVIKIDSALTVMGVLVDIVRDVVTDKQQQMQIQQRIQKVIEAQVGNK